MTIAWWLGSLYRRIIYRSHMRLIHPRWHWFTYMQPIDGQPQKWCQWCGERHIIYPAIVPPWVVK